MSLRKEYDQSIHEGVNLRSSVVDAQSGSESDFEIGNFNPVTHNAEISKNGIVLLAPILVTPTTATWESAHPSFQRHPSTPYPRHTLRPLSPHKAMSDGSKLVFLIKHSLPLHH